MIRILGAVACIETDIRRERRLEGIQKAKAAGKVASSLSQMAS
ncbi:recombinase family protein [Pontixanthobacter aestiaquae]